MELALFQPDIAQNAGTLMRLGACLATPVNIIEPCGFPFGTKDMRRAVMDYTDIADIQKHASWAQFLQAKAGKRLVLLTTKASVCYTDFKFAPDDILLLGRESSGVPEDVHQRVDGRVTIPMQASARSINVAVSAAMVLGEALRQTNAFPAQPAP